MYLSEPFNRHRLFQGLRNWPEPVQSKNHEEWRLSARGEILASATAAILHLYRLRDLERRCIGEWEAVRPHLENPSARTGFFSPTLVELVNELDPFLARLRFIQNWVFPALGQALGVPVPTTMNIKERAWSRLQLPEAVRDRIRSYWTKEGLLLKHYRDLGQHYTSMIAHSFIAPGPPVVLAVRLPDNPECHAPKRLRFGGEIHAARFCERALRSLDSLFHDLAVELEYDLGPIQRPLWDGPPIVLQDGWQGELAVSILNNETGQAVAVGQTPDRRAFIRRIEGRE